MLSATSICYSPCTFSGDQSYFMTAKNKSQWAKQKEDYLQAQMKFDIEIVCVPFHSRAKQ